MSSHPAAGESSAPAAAAIVPRWEWRTFGERFGEADRRLAALEPQRVQESDELYLLSTASDVSAKVRDGLMDVKQLQQVDGQGLEQWLPVIKASFPLAAGEVRSVLALLGVPPDLPLAREEYTGEQLVEEVVGPSPALEAVGVHKRRVRYLVAGCTAELSEIRTAAEATRTIAVESEDPSLVVAALGELGLASLPNVCFARGLKNLTGFGAPRFAVIDVGTNSVKFLLAARRADGDWLTIVDRSAVTRLGEGLAEVGAIAEGPFARTVEAVVAMAEEARRNDVTAIAGVGTAGLRLAANGPDLIEAVRAACGLQIEVVSGEEEARLAYVAVTAGLELDQGSLAVFDTGGGSSQFTFGDGEHVDEQFSVPIGALRVTERYGLDGAVSEETVAAAREAIAGDLVRLDGRPTPAALVALGGAVTNLAAVKHGLSPYDPDVVRGTVLDTAEVDRQIELYRSRSAEERRRIVGLQSGRAEVILAGACIVRTVLAMLGRDSLVVSDRGLRHGLLLERFGADAPAASQRV